jgi:lipopolysaccharide transport system ATP-binding protein
MSDIAIRVENLSKRYVIHHQRASGDGLRHALQDKLTAPFRWMGRRVDSSSQLSASRSQPASEDFWALKDVSFDIKQGEVVGIIGRNGAGKSTLLKILSRITEPTSGRITINGRVASLLEVGTGFHPELTGRENIFLNGAILGMSRVEIKAKFDEIVAFAEVERFLDTPVKRYSSGMYVRLAFAVAAHLEPEILIVDEVLAVGDAQFQKRCLGKMQDVSKSGRTVLFVSHNMNAIQMLCGRCLQLLRGERDMFGETTDVVAHYLNSELTLIAPGVQYPVSGCGRTGSGEIRFSAFSIAGSTANELNVIRSEDPFEITLIVQSSGDQSVDSLGVTILDHLGNRLITADSLALGTILTLRAGVNLVRIRIAQLHLKPDTYILSLWVGRTGVYAIDYLPSVGEFEVIEKEGRFQRRLPQDSAVYCDFSVESERHCLGA